MFIDDAALPKQSMSLQVLVSRLAVELFDMAADVNAVQDALGFTAAMHLSGAQTIALQKLDLTEQTMRAIAEIVVSLSGTLPGRLDVAAHDLLSTCRLSSLADRLMGSTPVPYEAIELF